MKVAIVIAVMILAAASATAAMAAQTDAAAGSNLTLDRFDAKFGYPTFPHAAPAVRKPVQVPIVFNGANTNALRINDVTKIPVINHHTPPGEAPR